MYCRQTLRTVFNPRYVTAWPMLPTGDFRPYIGELTAVSTLTAISGSPVMRSTSFAELAVFTKSGESRWCISFGGRGMSRNVST